MASKAKTPVPRAAKDRSDRRQRREQARTRLLRSALELSERGPFHDLTVDEIASAAGLSRSAFYTHFGDKHEMLLEAVGEVGHELEELSAGWWRADGPPADRVRGALEAVVSVYADHVGLLRVATEVATYDEEVRRFWLGVTARFIDAAADHIRADQREGLIPKTLDAQATAEVLVWMAERCCYIYLALGKRTAEEVVEAMAPVWTAALYPGVIPADALRPEDVADVGEAQDLGS